MYQYWRDDTFVKEIVTATEQHFGELGNRILDGHTIHDVDGLKNFFIAEEHKLQSRNPAFDHSHITVGVDVDGRLFGHSYPITIINNAYYLVTALALSPHLVFAQLYYKYPDKADLPRIYADKPNAILLTEQEVHELNQTMILLGKRLETGYIVSKNRRSLKDAITAAKRYL